MALSGKKYFYSVGVMYANLGYMACDIMDICARRNNGKAWISSAIWIGYCNQVQDLTSAKHK